MTEIARSGKWNPGGGRWLELLPLAGLATYARASLTTPPVLTTVGNFDFVRVYCTQGTIAYREGVEYTDNGKVHSLEIKGFTPYDSEAKAAQLDSLFGYEYFLVRFCDNDGLIRLAGSKEQFLSLSYELGTDADVPGSRGYSLNLQGQFTLRPAYNA